MAETMETKRDVIRGAPTLFHAVALVAESKASTIVNIRQMDLAAPPNLYRPAVQLFETVLAGKRDLRWAQTQAEAIAEPSERKIALEVLACSARYLMNTKPEWFRSLDAEHYPIATDVQIPVRINGLMRVEQEVRLFCLQPWQKRLSQRQTRAALTVLSRTVMRRPELRAAELNLLDLSISAKGGSRIARLSGWDDHELMSEAELRDFTSMLAEAWIEYHENPAPKPSRSSRPPKDGQTDMFSPRD